MCVMCVMCQVIRWDGVVACGVTTSAINLNHGELRLSCTYASLSCSSLLLLLMLINQQLKILKGRLKFNKPYGCQYFSTNIALIKLSLSKHAAAKIFFVALNSSRCTANGPTEGNPTPAVSTTAPLNYASVLTARQSMS